MSFLESVSPNEAEGAVAQMYAAGEAANGYLPNFFRAWSLRPDVFAAWQQLNGAIKSNMDLRRYELATVAAAWRLRSSYCSLAHGSILAEEFLGTDGVVAMAADHRDAGLDEVDVAVIELAEKVAIDASSVTEVDLEPLRTLGLTDAEIFDVVIAAAARSFFTKTLDSIGVQPDSAYNALDPALRKVLVVGRPIAEA